MAEVKKSTVRLSDIDIANITKIIGSGAATNESEAIRVALAEFARVAPRMRAIERRLDELMEPNPMSGFGQDELLAFESSSQGPLKDLASKDLLRRGFFPDGRGKWSEKRPETTFPVAASRSRLRPRRR